MSSATHPYTTKISYSTDGGSTFTDLTNMKMVTPPDLDRGESITTVLDSPSKTEENQPGWRKSGELPFEARYTQALYVALKAIYDQDTLYVWKVTLPLVGAQVTAAKIQGSAWLKKLAITEASSESDDTFIIKTGLRLSGPWAFTSGA